MLIFFIPLKYIFSLQSYNIFFEYAKNDEFLYASVYSKNTEM